ncbi:MAG: hypothetical protein K6360_07175 [Deltaproteobacteria bacterium]
MFGRICPYCKERIKKDALVCRWCGRESKPVQSGTAHSPTGVFLAFLGVGLGFAAAFLLGYRRERSRWKDDQCYFAPDGGQEEGEA